MPLTMRPSGLGHGVYKDSIDYSVFSREWLIGRIYRTTEALAAAKARGVKLGNPRLADAIEATNKARQEAADAFAANVLPIMESPRPYLLAGSRLLAAARGRLCRCRASCSALSR
jgi:hypothetical protein